MTTTDFPQPSQSQNNSDHRDISGISIAIVGTDGAGKTVLTTCLAKGFQNHSADGTWLEPLTAATTEYVEKAWEKLTNSDWPDGTIVGHSFDLRWRLHLGNGTSCALRIIDAAGQTLRHLFAEEQINDFDQLDERIRPLAEYVRMADIVLFLVNLRDFAGEANTNNKVSNQWALKYAMDYLSRSSSPRRFLLVLTQIDLYRSYAKKYGNWGKVVQHFLPYVYAAYLADGRIKGCGVCAVNSTQVIVDKEGQPRRVPARDFKFEGFTGLLKWIGDNASDLVSMKKEKANQVSVPSLGLQPEYSTGQSGTNRSFTHQLGIAVHRFGKSLRLLVGKEKRVALGAIFILIAGWTCAMRATGGEFTGPSDPKEWPSAEPGSYRVGIDYGTFFDDIVFRNNTGSSLKNVVVDLTVETKDKPVHKVLKAGAVGVGKSYRWSYVMSVPKPSKGEVIVTYDLR